MSANLELQYRAVKMAKNSSSEILHFIVMLLWSYKYVSWKSIQIYCTWFLFIYFLANVGHGESKEKHGDHVALQYTMPDLLPWTNLVCDRFRPFTDEGRGLILQDKL